MAYACPVCAFPQADPTHLAHHLAFTAMTGDDEHAAWLDEHAPGWGEDGPDALAQRVLPHADEVDGPGAATDAGEDHDHGEVSSPGDEPVPDHPSSVPDAAGRFQADDVDDVLREARDITRARRRDGDESDGDDQRAGGDEPDGGEESDGDANVGDDPNDEEDASSGSETE